VSFGRHVGQLIVEPRGLVLRHVGGRHLRAAFRAAQDVQARVGRDFRQPAFERAASLEAFELRERFEKDLLRHLLDLLAPAEEPRRDAEDPRAVAPHDLREGGLVSRAREAHQFRVGLLLKLLRQ
jgi:hypothetical protein